MRKPTNEGLHSQMVEILILGGLHEFIGWPF